VKVAHAYNLLLTYNVQYTLCLKQRPNFETVFEILRTDFDDIWQKYSKFS